MIFPPLSLQSDPAAALIPSLEGNNRQLSQLADCFADQRVSQAILAQEDVVRLSDDYQRPLQGK